MEDRLVLGHRCRRALHRGNQRGSRPMPVDLGQRRQLRRSFLRNSSRLSCLIAEVGFEPHDLLGMNQVSYLTAPFRVESTARESHPLSVRGCNSAGHSDYGAEFVRPYGGAIPFLRASFSCCLFFASSILRSRGVFF